MSDLNLLLSLLLMHVLADFFLQPAAWVQVRAKQHWRCSSLYYHGLIHLGLNLLVLLSWYYLSWSAVSIITVCFLAFLLALSHVVIDLVKSYCHGLRYFIVDQLLHTLLIGLVWLYLINDTAMLLLQASELLQARHLLVVLAYLLLIKPGSVFISLILAKLATPAATVQHGSAAAGHLIGIAERLLILTLILVEQYSAVGLVVAAKSVLRFNDLRDSHDRALTEYILLGSLLSFGLTLLVAIALLGLLRF